MGFYEVLDQVVAVFRRRGRVTYRALKREFQLDDAALEDLKDELIKPSTEGFETADLREAKALLEELA
jgi:hypothetical protein